MWSFYQKFIINMGDGHARVAPVVLGKEAELMRAWY